MGVIEQWPVNQSDGMEGSEAFGGGKAGGSFDPLNFLKKPCVVFRIAALLFSVIAFGCISSKGWQFHAEKEREVCIMNGSATACQLGNGVAIVAFLASIGFLVGEYFFEQMSSVKSRKHFVLADLSFSGFWAFAYLISFSTMAYQWSQSDEPESGYGQGNIGGAILFSFLSVFAWGGCALFSFQRYRMGFEAAFGDIEATAGGEYQSYDQNGYAEPPFQQQGTDAVKY